MTIQPLSFEGDPQRDPLPTPVPLYYACDLTTGQILTELPLGGGTVRRIIGQEEQATFDLAWADDLCPDDWAALVVPGRTMIVQTIDDQPVQAWALLGMDTGGATVPLSASTLEHLPARTNVPNVDHAGEETEGIAKVLAPLVDNFGFIVETTPTGRTIDVWLDETEDRRVLDWITEHTAAEGAAEWRIGVRWRDGWTKQHIDKVIEVRPRIGSDRPDAIFDLDGNGRGCIASYLRTRSYGDGKGATRVRAVSEGSGDSRPMTDPLDSPLIEQGWPVWEARPSITGIEADSITDEDTELQRLAREYLRQRQLGTVVWQVTGDDTAPRPGRDFDAGDHIRIQVAPQGKRDPIGGTASPRVLGWEYDLASQRVTVIPWEDS